MDAIIGEILPKDNRRAARGVVVGWLVGSDGESPIVDYDGNQHGPLDARSIVAVSADDRDREVLMLFERGNARRPVIIGFLVQVAIASNVRDVRVDGERLVFDAKKEIILRCGEGSIHMRADGKVIIKGIDITTRARNLNKVKGAAVKIN